MESSNDQIERQQEQMESQAVASEGEYHLEEDDSDDAQPSSSSLCCANGRPAILTEALWFELKDLSKELINYIRYKCWKKKLLTASLAISAILVFSDLLFGTYIKTQLAQFVAWMARDPVSAVFAYIGIFVVATLIFVPPVFLVFGAGYAFSAALPTIWQGVLAAFIVSLIGSFISATIAFVRARYMMRDLIQLFAKRYPLISCADRVLDQNGLRLMLLLRLCPVIPFNALNYCCGITNVSITDFTTSLLGILPFQLFTVVVGSTAANYSTDKFHNNPEQELVFMVLLGTGGLFGLLAFFLIWRLVRTELQEELNLSASEISDYITLKNEQNAVEQGLEVSSEEEDGWFWVWA